MRSFLCIPIALALSAALPVLASSPEDVKGLWMTDEKDAVIEFKGCPEQPGALCGRIVWDKDAGTPASTCGLQIARLERYDDDAWRDGWVYDPRDKKKYKATLRIKAGALSIRAFVGVEVLGQTERFQRVAVLPAVPACQS